MITKDAFKPACLLLLYIIWLLCGKHRMVYCWRVFNYWSATTDGVLRNFYRSGWKNTTHLEDSEHEPSVFAPTMDPWMLLYAGERHLLTDAILTFSQHLVDKKLHAKQCQGYFKTVSTNASALGMKVNENKTQLLCIAPAIHSSVSSYIKLEDGSKLYFQSCWPTRDHIGRSTGISNPAWHLPQVVPRVDQTTGSMQNLIAKKPSHYSNSPLDGGQRFATIWNLSKRNSTTPHGWCATWSNLVCQNRILQLLLSLQYDQWLNTLAQCTCTIQCSKRHRRKS